MSITCTRGLKCRPWSGRFKNRKEQHLFRCCSWCGRGDSNLWPLESEFCDSPQNTMYIRCFCSLCCVWQAVSERGLLMLHRSKSWDFSKRLNSSLAVVRQWSDSRQTVVKIEGKTRRKQAKIGSNLRTCRWRSLLKSPTVEGLGNTPYE